MKLTQGLTFACLLVPALAVAAVGQQGGEADVVKISTSLVRIDVNATDKEGKTVRDLKANDFRVFENGKEQKIVSLTYVPPAASLSKVASPAADHKSDAESSVVLRPSPTPSVTRRLVIAIDDFTLSAESIKSTRKAIKRYVAENFRPGDAVAIAVLSKVKTPVVRFYLTREKLEEAVDSIGWYSGGSSEATSIPPTDTDLVGGGQANSWHSPDTRQINSLIYLLAAIKVVPGRVPIVLFSDGFVLPKESPERDVKGDESDRQSVLQPVEKLIDIANRQATTINTVDARGLLVSGLRASDMTPENVNISDPTGKNMGASPQKALQDILRMRKERMDQISQPQDTLDMIAKRTGGIAYLNRNDIVTALVDATDDGGYYLLAYEPSAEDFDPMILKMNRIHLEIKRKDVQIRYRTSFASH